jgi:hypothetical protein
MKDERTNSHFREPVALLIVDLSLFYFSPRFIC